MVVTWAGVAVAELEEKWTEKEKYILDAEVTGLA